MYYNHYVSPSGPSNLLSTSSKFTTGRVHYSQLVKRSLKGLLQGMGYCYFIILCLLIAWDMPFIFMVHLFLCNFIANL